MPAPDWDAYLSAFHAERVLSALTNSPPWRVNSWCSTSRVGPGR